MSDDTFRQGNCQSLRDPDVMFRGDDLREQELDGALVLPGAAERADELAKLVCEGCPRVSECLAWALEHKEPAGVWGKMTTAERLELTEALSA